MEIIEEHNRLLQLLQLLPRQQRRVMERYLAGFETNEISDQLNMLPATVRSNIRHGREKLGRLIVADEQDLHSWSGQQLWEAFQNGNPLPAIPRPVIFRAWKIAKLLKVPPERGREVKPLDSNELQHRRHESPFNACPWALDALAELGKTTKQMMVVVDSDGVVLWRGGDRKILGLADELVFVEGARWDIEHAGANGIALALATKQTVMVRRWEHYVQAQHGLSCIAAPVRSPQDGRALCALNLTGTEPTIHRAIRREVDTLAMRLHRHLRLMEM